MPALFVGTPTDSSPLLIPRQPSPYRSTSTGTPSNNNSNSNVDSTPYYYFVALGIGVIFLNFWIVLTVRHLYHRRHRALSDTPPSNVDELMIGRPAALHGNLYFSMGAFETERHRRRRRMLLSVEILEAKFPIVKYKVWRHAHDKDEQKRNGGDEKNGNDNNTNEETIDNKGISSKNLFITEEREVDMEHIEDVERNTGNHKSTGSIETITETDESNINENIETNNGIDIRKDVKSNENIESNDMENMNQVNDMENMNQEVNDTGERHSIEDKHQNIDNKQIVNHNKDSNLKNKESLNTSNTGLSNDDENIMTNIPRQSDQTSDIDMTDLTILNETTSAGSYMKETYAPTCGSDMEDVCAICLDTMELTQDVRILTCDHVFHDECVTRWLTQWSASCPLCKHNYYEETRPNGQETSNTETGSTSNRQGIPNGSWTQNGRARFREWLFQGIL